MTSESSKEQALSSSGIRFLIAGAIFLSVLVFYAYDYVDGLSYFRSVQNWPVTEGLVHRNTLAPVIPREKVDPLQKTFTAPTEEKGIEYSYKVDGKDYSSTRLVAVQPQKFLQSLKMFYDMPDEKMLGTKYPVGSPVEVHYNPENPAEACLDVSSGWKSRYVAICFSALTIVLPTVGFLLASLFIFRSESVADVNRTET
ncbi:hypothetical protein BH10CYA1_BH10CYA1_36020 [soil metagenome]